MTDLRTRWLGQDLESPVLASPSPLTSDPEHLEALQEAGAGAVVLPSLFGEQVALDELLSQHADVANLFAGEWGTAIDLQDYNWGPAEYVRLVQQARRRLRIPVVASLSTPRPIAWGDYPKMLESAGADAIELNVHSVPIDPDRSSAQVEDDQVATVAALAECTSLPIAVKLGRNVTAAVHLARRLRDAGATALVLFHRLHEPDIDIGQCCGVGRLELSTRAELTVRLRWLALIRNRVDIGLSATGGIWDGRDAAKALLAGADVVEVASALLRHGPKYVAEINAGLAAALEEAGVPSAAKATGRLALPADVSAADPIREAYVAALISATVHARAFSTAEPGG